VMRSRVSSLLIVLAFAVAFPPALPADRENGCPVTRAPDHPFIPPSPDHPYTINDGRFLFGTPGLWALVNTRWKLHRDGNKLPFFSQDFYYGKTEVDPRLAVVARRLDSPEALVWSDWVNGAGPSFVYGSRPDPNGRGFMVTSLRIPTAGCWEISAHYTPARDKAHTLTYTVWVEP